MKDNRLKIIYIVGSAHSGSTLMDIVLGSTIGFFSGGELTNIVRPSITSEYCSCGKIISKCELWAKVFEDWKNQMSMTIEEYRQLRYKFERSKSSIRTIFNQFFPGKSFKLYCEATKSLFLIIKEYTGEQIIIDSSKGAPRIAVLRRISDLRVIHVCRNFTGVLNSHQTAVKKDIKAGIEEDIPAWKTSTTLVYWLFGNLLAQIFSIGIKRIKIKYKKFVFNPNTLKSM